VTEAGNCTLCADNPLVGASGGIKVDHIVDHIYVSNSTESNVVGSKRTWDSMTAINSLVYLPLSDHFAVQLTYQIETTSTPAPSSEYTITSNLTVKPTGENTNTLKLIAERSGKYTDTPIKSNVRMLSSTLQVMIAIIIVQWPV
jgi:hypothetical protein